MSHRIYFILLCLAFAGTSWAEQPSLCTAEEDSIFWCETKAKRFELCASKNLSASEGYMQYRAGTGGSPAFRFPEPLAHPRGNFVLLLYGWGTQLKFQNAETTYKISESVKGYATRIVVERKGKADVEIPCGGSDTLTLTSTIRLFEMFGARE